ncbi:MAG: hypothetical protein OXT71_10480 [Acidobacteriota bacterium]|nr:hypothetical protein [Acidobacteriota bacterium]
MTLELMAIIAATITLGGLILTQSRAAARERAEIRERMSHLEVSLGERMSRLEVSLEKRMARTEGTLDVLREYFVGSGRGAV